MDVLPFTRSRRQSEPQSDQPRTFHHYRRNTPPRAPCPHCGKLGQRKQILPTRIVRDIAYKAIHLVHVTTAEYRASCSCCTTFRSQIEGIEAKAHYTNKVREAVMDRLLDDHMNLDQIRFAISARLSSLEDPPTRVASLSSVDLGLLLGHALYR